MAKTIGEINISYERRPCEVGDRHGYFHCWEQYSDVITPGLAIGSHPGGQFSRIFGIVEFEEGVERVDPTQIKFLDGTYVDSLFAGDKEIELKRSKK